VHVLIGVFIFYCVYCCTAPLSFDKWRHTNNSDDDDDDDDDCHGPVSVCVRVSIRHALVFCQND